MSLLVHTRHATQYASKQPKITMDSFRYWHDSPPATSSRAVKTTRPIAGWVQSHPSPNRPICAPLALATDISLYQLILGRRDLAECGVDEPVTHCGLGTRGGEVCAAGGFVPYAPPDTLGNRRSPSPRQTGSTPRLPDPLECLPPLTKAATGCLPTTLTRHEGMFNAPPPDWHDARHGSSVVVARTLELH